MILALFVLDAFLVVLYLGDFWLGSPLTRYTHQHDLNGESNFPAWLSSAKYLLAGGLMWYCVRDRVHLREPRSWLLALIPLMLVAFSCDETAQIHESLGRHADKVAFTGDREHSAFQNTGAWTIIIGIPAILGLAAAIFVAGRATFQSRGLLRRYVLGLVVMLTGAVGVETLSNFLPNNGGQYEVAVEESLEMIGATVMLWAAHDEAVRKHAALVAAGPAHAEHSTILIGRQMPHPSRQSA